MTVTDVRVTNFRYGSVPVGNFLHATGGLRGVLRAAGWLVGPLPHDAAEEAEIGPVPDVQVKGVLRELGAQLFGGDEIAECDPLLPSRSWTPLLGAPWITHQPADTWGWIASAASAASDAGYAALAQSISVSLRAAGIRLRDASDEHHRQLVSAIARGQQPDLRFANAALAGLHLAFHSLLSEMGSARDYLATVAARRVGAPTNIEAASRLVGWAGKSAGRAAAADPLVGRILDAWDKGAPDPWLHDLGEYRNLFLHRQPLGAGEHSRWLRLVEHNGGHRRALLITMQIECRPGVPDLCDALTRFVGLYEKLCRLADFAATLAAYAPMPTTFVAARS